MARMAQSTDLEQRNSGAYSPEDDDDDYAGSDNGQAYPLTGRGRKFKSTDEFTRVPGRLSLLGANSKYVVSVGEVRRRLAPPECLNASLLGGVLRKAKAKNGGHDLRKALDEIGLNLPAGRRKATPTTMLTSLVEEESRLLAAQFNDVCSSMFPVAEVANTITQQHAMQAPHPYYVEDRQRSIQAAMHVTNELRNVLETYLQQEQEEQLADEGLQSQYPPNSHFGLRQFSLITHGFGLPIVNGVLSLFQNFLNILMKTSSGMAIRDEHALHNAPLPNSNRPRRPH